MSDFSLKFDSIPALFHETAQIHKDVRALYAPHLKPSLEISYREMQTEILDLAAGILAVGLKSGDHIAFFADNGPRWITTDLAILTAGCVTVPRGTDTSTDEFEFILSHSDAKAVFVQNRKVYDRLAESPAFQKMLFVVVMDDQIGQTKLPGSDCRVLSYTEILGVGRSVSTKPDYKKISAESIASIVYTSGTTGAPKGVVLTHRNLVSQPLLVDTGYVPKPGDLLLTILPAWHAYERAVEYFSLYHGVTIVYSDKRYIKEDLISIRPQLFPCVPRIWEMVYDGIHDKIKKSSSVQYNLYTFFVNIGIKFVTARRIVRNEVTEKKEISTAERTKASILYHTLKPLYALGDKLIYKKVRRITGGKLCAAISGGGSLAPYLDLYFEIMDIPILNGYGLTETSPVIAVRRTECNIRGSVGPVLKHTKVRIVSEKGEILSGGAVGEIEVSGPQVMKEYYKNPDSTSKVFTQDGWLKTGDLGWITPQGQLVLTGRAKDTIVLSSGENIEPEKIENAGSKNNLVSQMILVGQDQKFLSALVVPNFSELAVALDLPEETDAKTICAHPEAANLVKQAIRKSMNEQGGFKHFETINSVHLLNEPFSQDNGLLTQTMKVKRNLVLMKYENEIKNLYL